jgi:hypothetical protein
MRDPVSAAIAMSLPVGSIGVIGIANTGRRH